MYLYTHLFYRVIILEVWKSLKRKSWNLQMYLLLFFFFKPCIILFFEIAGISTMRYRNPHEKFDIIVFQFESSVFWKKNNQMA